MLTPQSGRQVRESGAPSRVFSCASDRPFVIERQVCSLSTKPQMSTTLHYTITVCVCNRTAHSQHCLPATRPVYKSIKRICRLVRINKSINTHKINCARINPHMKLTNASKCLTVVRSLTSVK